MVATKARLLGPGLTRESITEYAARDPAALREGRLGRTGADPDRVLRDDGVSPEGGDLAAESAGAAPEGTVRAAWGSFHSASAS